MTRAGVASTLGYGLVALGGAGLNGMTFERALPGPGIDPGSIPLLAWGGVGLGLLLTRSPFSSRWREALPAPLSTLPSARSRVLGFVIRQACLAFLIRWAVGGVIFWVALPLVALADVYRRGPTTRARLAEALVLYLLFFGYGVGGIWNFVGHFFMADTVAASVGWPPGSPFQQELAFYALGTGVVGLLTPWWRDHFWVAAAVAPSIFVYGAAFTHIEDYLVYGNTAPANWGPAAVGANLVIPTVVLLGTWFYFRTRGPMGREPSPGDAR